MTTTLADSIHLQVPEAASPSPEASSRHVLIYFIPGNPGLIEYYRVFLTYLATRIQDLTTTEISQRGASKTFKIIGNSLAGFHVSPNSSSRKTASDGKTHLPLNLEQQIEDVERQLLITASSYQTPEGQKPHIILIGHSVGAYITLSLLSRRTHPDSPLNGLDILGTIGLFPTIVDLHASPNGQKFSWLAPLPGFSLLLQTLARILSFLLPWTALLDIVKTITGHPARAARVTVAFLSSPQGVRQAVYMAQHELLEMLEDNWGDEVWSRPKLFFYFATADHWIADHTRDTLISTRSGDATGNPLGPKMEVERGSVPHDFCVWEGWSRLVGEKVAGCIEEIVRRG